MCLFTMKKTTMAVIMFTFLACQVLHIFGKVIVLRSAPQSTSLRKLICLSEDDGSALIWNTLDSNSEVVNPINMLTSSKDALSDNKINCKMKDSEDCLKFWSRKNWATTNSSITSMAPVFDQRWEEFKEYENPSKYESVGFLQTSATLSFSTRAQKNVHILFCKNKNYTAFCYSIIIGDLENTVSAIRKCPNGLDDIKINIYSNIQCAVKYHINHTPLSINEWRSFIITLDSVTRNITVYDNDNKIMTYNDAEILHHPNETYEIFLGGGDNMLLRFHLYDFLHTTIENANLTSPILKVNDTTVCVQMFIGLCPECDAHVLLRDSTSNRELEKVIVKGSLKTAVHGLPTWQPVEIKKNLTSINSLVVQVIPRLNKFSVNPLWAIANVRQCPPTGSWKKNILLTKVGYLTLNEVRNRFTFPKTSCQKLFYNERTVVNAIYAVKKNITLEGENCDKGKIGPRCSFSCKHDLGGTDDCYGTATCYESGCTCPPGFLGDTCSDPCEQNKYGHGCKKTCGVCTKPLNLNSSVCDRTTGACIAFCNNTLTLNEKLYIPPLCQNAIDVLSVIKYISNTSIQVMVPIIWKDKEEEITYSFIIRKEYKQQYESKYSEKNKTFPNTTYLIGNFENLTPDTKYEIKCLAHGKLNKSRLISGWQLVETDCNPTQNFDTTIKETSLTINWRISKNQLYSCPANKYRVVVTRVDKLEQIVNETASFFPYNVSSLTPYTLYNVTILYKYQKLFSKEIHTLERVMLKREDSKHDDSSIHHEAWLIPTVCLILAGATFYFYQRKQQLMKQVMQDEIDLSQNIDHYEHIREVELTSVIPKDLPTPSERQSLSSTTLEVSLNVIKNNREKTEILTLMKVKDFEDYVREAIQSEALDKQYRMFSKGQTQSWYYGQLLQNKSKNRYENVIAYDKTRVILKKLPDDPYSDYINANYITGYKKQKCYIATQGPLSNTIIDFWRMIWQENVLIICMLVNISENDEVLCEQYWPDIGKKKTYGDINVFNVKHNVFADYCFRTFQVTCGDKTRKIEHLHYTAWPDYGVPLYTHSIVMYLKKLLATSPGNGPVVVHSSAGVGKTGMIILCDICLHRAAAEGFVDVFAEMESIRSERINMVNNKQQYLLAHLALVECLLFIPITLPCNKMLPIQINELKKQLPAQQQRLHNTAWQNEALRQVTTSRPLSEHNRSKNRFPELISDKIGRIYLKKYPISDKDSDYLPGVYVDGVKFREQYIATQLPLPWTVNDFWRMIAEFKVELILMLQAPDPQDPTCSAIVPTRSEFKPVSYLNIIIKETVEFESYISQKLLLIDNSEKPTKEQSITILCLTEWKPGRKQQPPPVVSMVTLWQATEKIARGDGPIVTLCHDGVTGCGLYLALSFMLERMAVERECDVFLAVRAIRRSRPDFVQSLEHLEYLCDAAVTYFKYFEAYANFS